MSRPASYPHTRLRRNRKTEWSRAITSESNLSPHDLILPIVIIEGEGKKEAIESMPDFYRLTIDLAVEEAKKAKELGISAILLFPHIDQKLKTSDGSEALNPENLICRAISRIKKEVSGIGIATDAALDPYTSHGHDGVLDESTGNILNDATVKILAQQGLLAAKAGADIIAPSDMMDGTVQAMRNALEENNFHDVQIMSYSAKYASNFYGPFRDAVGSKANFTKHCRDKKTYQMHYTNAKEALLEVEMDIIEGADMVIIKPGTPYLDVIRDIVNEFRIPVITYQVSGEYSMLKFGAKNDLFDENKAFYETLIGFKRAGASAIITYAAIQIAEKLKSGELY